LWQLMISGTPKVILELEKGQKGTIIFTSAVGDTTTFAGNGPYPE